MKNSKSALEPETESRLDGLSISFDVEAGVVTLDWDEDSPYADLCKAIEKDNSLLWKMLENYLNEIESDG